ncbi:MAG: helix-turn-helix domain-containing protein [Clostridiales bacterium]|jgi:transcriptional regulator with XRE-family HTH domain|nr:helix-turn-helix domain-containing protein [Clostridiales bacterium]
MTTGEKIKKRRKELSMSQRRLAELTGIAEITIRQYECNRFLPKIEQIKKIALALDILPVQLSVDCIGTFSLLDPEKMSSEAKEAFERDQNKMAELIERKTQQVDRGSVTTNILDQLALLPDKELLFAEAMISHLRETRLA